ncbi:MAG: thiamine phosphate synthase [Chthoniobacterales bacterium]
MSKPNSLEKAYLYGILDLSYTDKANALATARAMLGGGIDILQLRAKKHPPDSLGPLARKLAMLCNQANVPFIINDYPALALESGASGVHVGQDDLSVREVREQIGSDKIVGLSTHSLQQAHDAQAQKPDYIGFGPLFATPTKPDYRPIGIKDIATVHKELSLPIFCIGGIKLENLEDVIQAGTKRAVIVSGILQADDITAYCRKCVDLLKNHGAITDVI